MQFAQVRPPDQRSKTLVIAINVFELYSLLTYSKKECRSFFKTADKECEILHDHAIMG